MRTRPTSPNPTPTPTLVPRVHGATNESTSPGGARAGRESSGVLTQLKARPRPSTAAGLSDASSLTQANRPSGAALPASPDVQSSKRPRLDERPAANAAPSPLPKGTRQQATADTVHKILLERSGGASTWDIVRATSIGEGTVSRWINPKRWQSGELPASLSRMADYGALRDPLDALVKQMDLMSGDLPPPAAKIKARVDANTLKAALELMLQKRSDNIIGRGRAPGTVSIVAKSLGIERRTLGEWLRADGSLNKPAGSLARLDGYLEVRGELQALLARLGHAEAAASLRVSAENSVQKMTAALLVDALKAVASDRKASFVKIGATLGVLDSLIGKYVTSGKGSLRDLALVQKLPDYGQHREALAAALEALEHHEQASSLPPPTVDAAKFLQILRGDLPRIVDGMNAMRSNPGLSPYEAAIGANVFPAAFSAVIGRGGALRARSDIDAVLTRFNAYLTQGINEQLERLSEAAQGKQSNSAAVSAMTRLEMPARGSIPAKVFVVRGSTGDPGPKAKNRLEKIYANNPDLVRKPRSYDAERPRQALRWLSTVLKERFPDSREVQCYYHAGSKQIVVSSNTNATNIELADFLAHGGLTEIADAADLREVASTGREARHLAKLRARTDSSRPGAAADLPDEVRKAIASRSFHVPTGTFSTNGKTVNLHAERRILHYLRTTFGEQADRRWLAGTMRPCGTCAEDLGFEDTERRGPFWLSRPAQALVDTQRVIERNVGNAIGTYVTHTREGRMTIDYDTDSDSDAD